MKQFLVICLLFSSITAFSQVGLNVSRHAQMPNFASFTEQINSIELSQAETASSQNTPVPLVYSYKKLAFFCKVDVQLENVVKFPVKFRLGSVEYVDYLEGK